MIKQSAVRMTVDISMTIFSLVLMGGHYFFPWTGVHEVLGAALFVLRGVHVVLNRRWYASLAKGAYRPFRIMQAVVNCGILECALFLMISGIMISQHVFAFLGISGGANFARKAHMLASHWYFLFMSLHFGLHAVMISRKIAAKSKRTGDKKSAFGGLYGLSRLRFMCCLSLAAPTDFIRLFCVAYGVTSSCGKSSFSSIWKKAMRFSSQITSQSSCCLQRRRITMPLSTTKSVLTDRDFIKSEI